jgi:spermidine/putrescine transport system substrate-binding protein
MGRRAFLQAGGWLLAGLLSGCAASATRPGQLNLYNYPNYIAPETVPEFEARYGVRVVYDNYSAQDTLEAKLRIGRFGYDLVVASDYKIGRFRKLGILQALNQKRLTHLDNLFDWLRDASYDPGNRYSIPWQWGTTGIGYNKDYVHEDVRSWAALWDSRYRGQIDMLNERRDCIAVGLLRLGYSVNSVDERQLREAEKLLIEQRPLLKHYTSDSYIDEMASDDAWICQGWSGDVFQAIADNPKVVYAIPEEGSMRWVDNMCIPVGAPHKELAETFMNYVLEPEVSAKISNAVEFATPNRAALPLVRQDLRDNPLIYPPPEVMRKLSFLEDLGPGETLWNDVWEQVKLARGVDA